MPQGKENTGVKRHVFKTFLLEGNKPFSAKDIAEKGYRDASGSVTKTPAASVRNIFSRFKHLFDNVGKGIKILNAAGLAMAQQFVDEDSGLSGDLGMTDFNPVYDSEPSSRCSSPVPSLSSDEDCAAEAISPCRTKTVKTSRPSRRHCRRGQGPYERETNESGLDPSRRHENTLPVALSLQCHDSAVACCVSSDQLEPSENMKYRVGLASLLSCMFDEETNEIAHEETLSDANKCLFVLDSFDAVIGGIVFRSEPHSTFHTNFCGAGVNAVLYLPARTSLSFFLETLMPSLSSSLTHNSPIAEAALVYIAFLGVHPDMRNKKIGQNLVDLIKHWAEIHGYPRLAAHIAPQAKDFWATQEFKKATQTKLWAHHVDEHFGHTLLKQYLVGGNSPIQPDALFCLAQAW